MITNEMTYEDIVKECCHRINHKGHWFRFTCKILARTYHLDRYKLEEDVLKALY